MKHIFLNFIQWPILIITTIINVSPSYGLWWPFSSSSEQCNQEWIPGNISDFRLNFEANVFGQPLVESLVANAVQGHLNASPKKALVFSFHGWPGCGKNFVSELLANSLYKKGLKESSFVKFYNSRHDFPDVQQVERYKVKLREDIEQYLKRCQKSLFIFDEIDMMPYKLLDVIHPYIDYNGNVGNVDPREAIFIFLSNKGGNDISDKMLELWKDGLQRDDLKFSDFQSVLRLAAFNEKGGLQHCDNINSHLVSYFVPFLPMEKSHVIQCIEAEFQRKNYAPTRELILEVLEQIPFTPKESVSSGLFSTSGCKGVDSFVATTIELEKFQKRKNKKPSMEL